MWTFLAIVDSSTGCVRAIASETKRSHSLPGKRSGRLHGKLVSWEVQTALRQRTLNHGGDRKSESENARQSSGGNLSATQLSEQRARRTINSDNWRTNEDSSIRHAESLQDANHAGIGNLAMDWLEDTHDFCVSGIRTWSGWHRTVQSSGLPRFHARNCSVCRACLDQDLGTEHLGLSSGTTHHKGDTAWEKGIRLGKSQTNPGHFVRTKNGAMGARMIRRLKPTKLSETSFLLGVQDVPLVPGTKRTASWETQETPDICTSLTTGPRKTRQMTNQAVQATVHPRRHHHHKL